MATRWWDRIKLPRTAESWVMMAAIEEISGPSERKKKSRNFKSSDAEIPSIGKLAVDVHFQDAGNWESASKMQLGHYLTAHIIFQFGPPKSLLQSPIRDAILLFKESDNLSKAFLQEFEDWKLYRQSLKQFGRGRPQAGKASNVGVFTTALMANRAIPSVSKEDHHTDTDMEGSRPPSSRIRAKGSLAGAEPDAMDTSDISPTRDRTTGRQTSSDETGGSALTLEPLIQALSINDSDDTYQSDNDVLEDVVNHALLDFLMALCGTCPHVSVD
ncbi:hypothetical protein N7474_009659 [Penicillium riverlandense]|uniref:uncharacterized protein n=1 Tax=Penicillium riverlandense TaxID=1903569 RepID=UPI00254721BF|nr:uncharacterized protein N7474_009659 [Penicillium riverlandense]KAJ5808390.1 hypothetical protein N7474_009659 [Penicillium riverlandense]